MCNSRFFLITLVVDLEHLNCHRLVDETETVQLVNGLNRILLKLLADEVLELLLAVPSVAVAAVFDGVVCALY